LISRKGALALSFIIFVTIGYVGAVFGPAKDDLAAQVGSDLGAMGALFTAFFLGALVAQSTVGTLVDRMGTRPVLLAGAALMGVGLLGILLSQGLWVLLALAVLMGIGFGALDTASNILVAHLSNNSVAVMNLLHMFFGVGSVIGPAVASATLALADDARPAIWPGIIVLLALVPGILLLPKASAATPDTQRAASGGFSYRSLLLWTLAALMLIYVAAEAGLGAWINTYAERTTSVSKEIAALTTSAFWFALTAGRVAGAVWGSRFPANTVLGVSLGGSLAGGLLLVIGEGNALLTVIAVLVIGLFFGPPYPTVMAMATAAFRSGPGKAASVVASMASLGGMAGPWVQGVLLERVSPVSSAIFTVVLILGMLALFASVRRQTRTGSLYRTASAVSPGA
jgi:fucose permease